jgi:hypothetical protein
MRTNKIKPSQAELLAKAKKKADSLSPKPTADSTFYYGDKEYIAKLKGLTAQSKPEMDKQFNISDKAKQDRYRQSKKGKPGYDKNGFPVATKAGEGVMGKMFQSVMKPNKNK